MNDNILLKALKYIRYLQEGNKPRYSGEAIRALSKFLNEIEKLSAKKNSDVTIGIMMPSGEVKVSLLKDCGYVFHHLFPVIFENVDSKVVDKYFEITTRFLSSNNIKNTLKAQIIDFENKNLSEVLEQNFSLSPNGFKALQARIDFCTVGLSSPNDAVFGDIRAIEIIYSGYISKSLTVFVNNGQILQGLNFLSALYESSRSTSEQKCIVKLIISHSTSFNLISKTELNSLLDEHEDYYDSDDIEHMRAEIFTDPSSMLLSYFSVGNGNLSLRSTNNKDITTVISFSIPNTCKSSETRHMEIDNKTEIIISPVAAFWADPMFKCMSSWKIANMGWSHFCEVEPKKGENYTHVKIIINELFTPDIHLTEASNIPIDFSEKEALMGRPYYPHKEFIIKTLLGIFDEVSKELDIERTDISINLFSNYFVQHIDNATGENIHHKLFAITNPDSYSKTATRFLERLNSINLSDSLIDVRDLLTSTKIETEKNLMEFVSRSIDLFVKHNIENHGGYIYLWKTNNNGELKPCREPEAQPYIFSHLKAVFDFMGIQLSREVESSNGEIDFLLSYTNSQHKLLRLCVELKLAHASKIEKGLTKQLPAYMKGERCSYGIYIALWFKGENFDEPTKYTGVKELQSRLDEINSNNKIQEDVIDSV